LSCAAWRARGKKDHGLRGAIALDPGGAAPDRRSTTYADFRNFL
jgi:hypothetical protein